MEQTEHVASEQSVNSKVQSVLEGAESSAVGSLGVAGIQHLKSDLASVTPEKTSGSSSISNSKEANHLPEKYWSILEFFNRMTSSLRLLGLHKKIPTFQNICSQVERLTGRKFEYKHLAQIKYLIPEAIQINKILIHDMKTMCMKPDIKVTLLFDVVEGHHEQSAFIALSHTFASRLKNFLSAHPKDQTCDIPEAVLPEPFNGMTITADPLPLELSTSSKTELVRLSHFGPFFNRSFSGKTIHSEIENSRSSVCPLAGSSSNSDNITDKEIEKPMRASNSSVTALMSRSSAQATVPKIEISDNTPVKGVTENDDFVLETPAMPTPRRAMPTCEDKEKTMTNEFTKSGSQTAKRSLDFSKFDSDKSSLDFLSADIGQSTTFLNTSDQMKDDRSNFCTVKCQTSNQGYIFADEQTSFCLSDLVPTIHHIFQSLNCRPITKEELVHKIIMNNCDIDESINIEEQIEQLEKLVPDWIHKQVTASGDKLYNISLISDLDSVRKRATSI